MKRTDATSFSYRIASSYVVASRGRLVVLGNAKNPGNPSMLTSVVEAASPLGLKVKYREVIAGDVTATLAAILQDQPDVLFVIPDLFLYTQRGQIIDFTLNNRTPPCTA